jgi:hypothetical protein
MIRRGASGNRILRRSGVSRPDASDDALGDDRVFGPRQHIRAKLTDRRVKFAREANNGGKAFGLPLAPG